MHQAPTAKIGLLANASLRVEPYTTPYQIMSHPCDATEAAGDESRRQPLQRRCADVSVAKP